MVSSVNYAETLQHFTTELRRNPKAPRPPIRMDTAGDFLEWKNEMRAYDAALIAVGLATPMEIQRKNAMVPPQNGRARIVTFANYGRPAQPV